MKLRLYGLGVLTVVIFALNPLSRVEGQETGQVLQQVAPSSAQNQPTSAGEKVEEAPFSKFLTPQWVTAFLAICSFVWSVNKFAQETKLQRETRQDETERQFLLKVIEPVLASTSGPVEAKSRARAVSALTDWYAFRDPKRKKEFKAALDKFIDGNFEDGGKAENNAKAKEEKDVKIDFWKTIVEHPNNAKQTLKLWNHLFPEQAVSVEIVFPEESNQVPPEKEKN